jgi:glycosyltransferase involved in cell wall biosynthesis
LNIPAQKITPTLLGYDRENFHVRPYLSPPNKPYFLYIGRHDPYKNVTGLISAFAALSNPQDFELQIAGSFDSRFTPILKTQVLELGLSEQVKFLEYVSYTDLPILLNQALALVFPSFWEGFGLPVLEAMACGTPVITSNVSSLPEVTGDAALLINPRRIPEITTAMESIINEQGLGAKLSALGLERAKLFNWETTGAETQEVLLRYLS